MTSTACVRCSPTVTSTRRSTVWSSWTRAAASSERRRKPFRRSATKGARAGRRATRSRRTCARWGTASRRSTRSWYRSRRSATSSPCTYRTSSIRPRRAVYEDNPVVRQDEPRKLPFTAKPHWEVGESLGILDIPRGTKMSGSRFYVLRGSGAALQRALIAWMIDLKLDAGFTEIYPPFLTKRETLVASSHLPHFAENQYHDEQDDLWLIPTAEPQLVSLHRDEILDGRKFPLHYVAYTACFRREHMSAGRDVRGIKRGHQFDKVEMVVYCDPEDSPQELQGLVDRAVEVLERLEIPVRVIELCTGELAFQATRGFDVETWAPGVGEWVEVSSCSNCGSF